jgi:hypothetical protein
MEVYAYTLQADCETWFSQTYPNLSRSFNTRPYVVTTSYIDSTNETLAATVDEFPDTHIAIAVGPWKGLYIKFKKPGELLTDDEKQSITVLREQGHRVEIIRYLEDFQTFMIAYLQAPRSRKV